MHHRVALQDKGWLARFNGLMRPWFVSALQDESRLDLQPGWLTPTGAVQRSAAVQGQRTAHCQIDRLSAGPHEFQAVGVSGRAEDEAPLVLLYVAKGCIQGSAGGQGFTAGVGEGLLWDSRVGMSGHAAAETRLLRLLVSRDRALDGVPGSTIPVATAIPSTPTLQACASFTLSMTDSDLEDLGPDCINRLERVLTALLHAQAVEVLTGTWSASSLGRLSIQRVEHYIDRHLHERTLTATTIADALGVSPSTLRTIFAGSGQTATTAIRARRVQAVARRLRSNRAPTRLAELAAEHGFGSASAMTRAFVDLTGSTLTRYAEAGQNRSSAEH